MRRRRFLLAAPAIVLASALTRHARGFDHEKWSDNHGHVTPRFAPGHVLLQLQPDATLTQLQTILRRHQAMLSPRFRTVAPRTFLALSPPDQEGALAEELEASGFVTYTHPDHAAYQQFVPNDPNYILSSGSPSNQHAYAAFNYEAALDVFKMSDISSSLWPDLILFDLDTAGYPGTFSGGVFTPDTTAGLADLSYRTGYHEPKGSADVSGTGGHPVLCASLSATKTNNGSAVASIGGGGDFIPVILNHGAVDSSFQTAVAHLLDPANGLLRGLGGATAFPITVGGGNPATAGMIASWKALFAAGFVNAGAVGDANSATCQGGVADVPFPYGLGIGGVNGLGSSPYARVTARSCYGPAITAGGSGCIVAGIGGEGANNNNLPVLLADGTVQSSPVDTSGASCEIGAMARWMKAGAPQNSPGRISALLADPALGKALTGFTAGPATTMPDMLNMILAAKATRPTMIR